jgi:cell wall-associated NlpC family hydrolase
MRLYALAGALAIGLLTTGCASTGAVPRVFPAPNGSPAPASAAASAARVARGFDAYAIVGDALGLRGAPYRNGGADPNGFDCSGFTQYVFGQHGIGLPRAVKEQFHEGKPVKASELSPGDLVFFTTTEPGASHVAIAIGGDEFVHAPSSAGVVRVEHLGAQYWAQRFIGARRLN